MISFTDFLLIVLIGLVAFVAWTLLDLDKKTNALMEVIGTGIKFSSGIKPHSFMLIEIYNILRKIDSVGSTDRLRQFLNNVSDDQEKILGQLIILSRTTPNEVAKNLLLTLEPLDFTSAAEAYRERTKPPE